MKTVTETIAEIVRKELCPRGGKHTYSTKTFVLPNPAPRGSHVMRVITTACSKCGENRSTLREFYTQ